MTEDVSIVNHYINYIKAGAFNTQQVLFWLQMVELAVPLVTLSNKIPALDQLQH